MYRFVVGAGQRVGFDIDDPFGSDLDSLIRLFDGNGFAVYPLIDPVIIGDTTANGAISSLDATRVLQFVAGISTPQIPPLPAPLLGAANAQTSQFADTAHASGFADTPPWFSNTASIQFSALPPVSNSLFSDADSVLGSALTLDLSQSAALREETGKDWPYYTT